MSRTVSATRGNSPRDLRWIDQHAQRSREHAYIERCRSDDLTVQLHAQWLAADHFDPHGLPARKPHAAGAVPRPAAQQLQVRGGALEGTLGAQGDEVEPAVVEPAA